MTSKTFKLAIRQGTLVIPEPVKEYLRQCQGEIEVSLTVQSSECASSPPSSAPSTTETDVQTAWNRWLAEVDQLSPSPPQSEPDEYGLALSEKYRKQGLEL